MNKTYEESTSVCDLLRISFIPFNGYVLIVSHNCKWICLFLMLSKLQYYSILAFDRCFVRMTHKVNFSNPREEIVDRCQNSHDQPLG